MLERCPLPPKAEQLHDTISIPGRSEILLSPQTLYNDVELDFVLGLKDQSSMRAVYAWLSGTGDLLLSTAPQEAYRVKRIRIKPEYVSKRFAKLGITMQCSPFAYTVGETAVDMLGWTGYQELENAGTMYSEPLIRFQLTIPQHDLLMGDVNLDGRVDAKDASLVLSAAAEGDFSGWTEEQLTAADMNADGSIDARDASKILIKAAEDATGTDQTAYDVFLYTNGSQFKISVPSICATQGLQVVVDSELQLVYYIDAEGQKVNILHLTYGDLPLLKVGTNYFKYSGDIAEISILKRERWL